MYLQSNRAYNQMNGFERLELRQMMAADLQGWWVDAPNEAKWGETIQLIKAQVRNAGDAWAGSSKVGFFISRDGIGSSDDIPLQFEDGGFSSPQPSIDAYSNGPMFYPRLKLPASLPSGFNGENFFIVMKSDSTDAVFEGWGQGESNNFGSFGSTYDNDQIRITPATNLQTDLSGYWTSVTSEASWGNTIQVTTAQVKNTGSSPSGSFQVEWYLSRDQHGSSDDIRLSLTNGSTSYHHSSIAPNGLGSMFSVSLKLPNALPSGWNGQAFFVVMKTDSAGQGQVQETNEANNFGGAAISSYDWDNITIKSNQNVQLTGVPFVTQVIGRTNNLCQFAAGAMLMGQRFGNGWATRSTMQALSNHAGLGSFGGPTGTDSVTAANTVKSYMKNQGINLNVSAGWLTYDQIKQALREGKAVSVSLNYGLLGSYRAPGSSYSGGHQVVVTGFSESNGTWTILDPLRSSNGSVTVPSTTFRRAVDAFGGGGNTAAGWFIA